MDFLGESFNIPSHSIELLEFWYGKIGEPQLVMHLQMMKIQEVHT